MSVATAIDWYVACAYRPISEEQAPVRFSRGVTIHAKRLGTLRTACDLSAWSWPSYPATPFPLRSGQDCPACLAAISG